MTLTKDKESGRYKVRVKTLEGKTKTLSTGATSKREARRTLVRSKLPAIERAQKAGKLRADALAQILTGQRTTVEFALEEFGQWLTNVGRSPIYGHNCRGVLQQFFTGSGLAGQLVTSITERHIFDFINRDDEGGANWRKVKLTYLRKFFEFANAKGWLIGNPAKLVEVRMDKLTHAQKEPKPRNPFTDADVTLLLDNLSAEARGLTGQIATALKQKTPPPELIARLTAKKDNAVFWHAAIALGRYTGLRLGDIARLEWDSLANPDMLIVWTDKHDRRVTLPKEPKALADALAALPKYDKTYVFPEQQRVSSDVTLRANLSTYFRRICHRVGIEGKTFHDLRHLYISDCERKGIPIHHIARSVGHVSTQTTVGYMEPDQKEKHGKGEWRNR